MKHLYFVFYLLLAMVDAYSIWSEEIEEENNSYEENQNGSEENTGNYNESSENNDSYDNQNSDNRRDSPYNYPSYPGQSDSRGDVVRSDTNYDFADNRMYNQPDEYNNQDEGFQESTDDNNMENSNENELTNEDTENYYRRDEGYPESYAPSSQGGDDYRALKRKIKPTPRPKPWLTIASTDDSNGNTYERRSDRESPVTYGALRGGHNNRYTYNFHNKYIYTR